MNKTISINLGSIFFHIDEIAFAKLKSYLDDIKLYLNNEESKDEIISDIEARIAEIFVNERIDEQQVISVANVEKVIGIMGNPEDYKVDDTDYETHQNYKSYRKLYRDVDAKIIGGVSAGFGHYFRIDAIWIRVLFILFAVFSGGTGLIIYVACWLLIQPALTTSEKLAMRGEEINFSNIERKVKENYDKFAKKVDDIDYEKYKAQTKSGAQKLGNGLVEALNALGSFIKKLLGVLLIFISGLVLLSLLASIFGLGSVSFFSDFNNYNIGFSGFDFPIWVLGVLIFFSVGVPFFYVLILGLKLLINNLASLGKPTNISLFAVWIIAIFSLIFIGIKQNLKDTQKIEIVEVIDTPYTSQDTLSIKMHESIRFNVNSDKSNENSIVYDEDDNELTVGTMINVNFKSTNDSIVKIRVEKSARSTSKSNAKEIANLIAYNISTANHQLILDNYFTTSTEFVNHKLALEISVLLPNNIHIELENTLNNFKSRYQHIGELNIPKLDEVFQVQKQKLVCKTCPKETTQAKDSLNLN